MDFFVIFVRSKFGKTPITNLKNYVQRPTQRIVCPLAGQHGRAFRVLHHACDLYPVSAGQVRLHRSGDHPDLRNLPGRRLFYALLRRRAGRQIRFRSDGDPGYFRHVRRLRPALHPVGHRLRRPGHDVRRPRADRLRYGTLQGQPSGARRQPLRRPGLCQQAGQCLFDFLYGHQYRGHVRPLDGNPYHQLFSRTGRPDLQRADSGAGAPVHRLGGAARGRAARQAAGAGRAGRRQHGRPDGVLAPLYRQALDGL